MYYLVEITTYTTTTPTAKAIYSYTSHDEALAAFFQKMRGAIVNAEYATELCMIVDTFGAVVRHEFWERTNAQ